jgi:aldose 1-epimerase
VDAPADIQREASTAPIDLAGGGWTATLLPGQGGAVASLAWKERDILVPLPVGADPNGAFAGAFVMAPWANRLDGGHLPVLGALHQAGPINRPDEGTALHGLAREHPWQVASRAPDRITLVQDFEGAGAAPPLPWRWRAELSLALDAAGATLDLAIANALDAPFPFGFGWHPFFRRPPGTRLRFRAGTLFTRDARRLPVAPQPTEGVDGAEPAYEGLDTPFAGWDGVAEILRPDLQLRLEAEGAWARNLQVFAPAGSDVLCVEPVSHVPDAPNRPDIAGFGPMTLLPPGGRLAARLLLRAAEPAAPG